MKGGGYLRPQAVVMYMAIARHTKLKDAAWVSWGDYDARQLERDARFAACPSLLGGLPHFNARKWHAGLYDNRPKRLKQTVESLAWLGLVWFGLVWFGTVPITEG